MILRVPPPEIPTPSTTPIPDHILSPTAVAALVVIAWIVDFFSVGPAWVQTRLVFATVVTFVRQGFDDSPLDKWTVDKAAELIQSLLNQAHGSYIAGAAADMIVGFIIFGLFIFCLGCMLPVKWAKKTGRFSTLQFKETGLRKMNWQIWGMAVPLGLLADLPNGFAGTMCDVFVNLCVFTTGPIPALLFGAS